MLETCEDCGGKRKTHEIPPKRCMTCRGKGVVEVEEVTEISGHGIIDEHGKVESVIDEVKPWYKRIFN